MTMCKILLILAYLAWLGLGHRLQSSTNQAKSDGIVKGDTSPKPLAALLMLLSKTHAATAFNPSSLRVKAPRSTSKPGVSHGHLHRHALAQMNAKAAATLEKRVDATEGGTYTLQDFKEHYGEDWEAEWNRAEPAERLKYVSEFKVDEKISTTVKRVLPGGVICEIGAEQDGWLPIQQIPKFRFDKLTPGNKIWTWVKAIDLDRNSIELKTKSPRRIRPYDQMTVGEVVDCVIDNVQGHLAFCNIGAKKNAYLHISKVSDEYIENLSVLLRKGQTIKARIIDIDAEAEQVVLSCKGVDDSGVGLLPIHSFQVGQEVDGIVKSIVDYGAFVFIGAQKDALLLKDDEFGELAVGQNIKALVSQIDLGAGTISLRRIQADRKPLDALQAGEEVEGTVKRIKDFGVFLDIGAQKDALLHVSDVTENNKFMEQEDLEALFPVGDRLKVRIKVVDLDSRRLAVTLKSDDAGVAQAMH